jgi:hypothetical protein
MHQMAVFTLSMSALKPGEALQRLALAFQLVALAFQLAREPEQVPQVEAQDQDRRLQRAHGASGSTVRR